MQHSSTANRLLSLPLELKTEGEPGTFEGYGAIFGNKDRDGDIVSRGAFRESLKAGMPALLWQHDQKQPIGRFDEVREDDKGLFVKGRLVMKGRGLEAYELLKMGALNGLSIGFVTKEASRDPATRTRTITEADLMEISLVTFPANELARVSNVKAAISQKDTDVYDEPYNNERAFEHLLRDNGFSRTRAKTIISKGFKGGDLDSISPQEIASLIAEIKKRKLNLEVKLGPLLVPLLVWLVSAAGSGAIGYAVSKFLDELLKKEDIFTNGPPFELSPGQAVDMFLRSRHDQTNISYIADMLKGDINDHYFECFLKVVSWSPRGPIRKTIQLYNTKDGTKVLRVPNIKVGNYEDIKRWAKTAGNAQVEYARAKLGGHFGPFGSLKYIGNASGDKSPVSFIIRDA